MGYELQAISLSEDGSLRTPANRAYEERSDLIEQRRKAAEEKALREAEEERRRFKQRERSKDWAKDRRTEEANAWKWSEERKRAQSLLKSRVFNLLERNHKLDKNIYCPPGRWKVEFYLSNLHGRKPGHVFDFFKAGGAVLRRYQHNSRDNGRWAWQALRTFLTQLTRADLVEFDHPDDLGKDRYWRVPHKAARKKDQGPRTEPALQERASEVHTHEARHSPELDEKWARNRNKRESGDLETRETLSARASDSRRAAQLNPSQEERMWRQHEFGTWLQSENRKQIRAALGGHLMARLEREEDLDRAILGHPGEWKSGVFMGYVHERPTGSTVDTQELVVRTLERITVLNGGDVLAAEAVYRFISLLESEGFLFAPEARQETGKGISHQYQVVPSPCAGQLTRWLVLLANSLRERGRVRESVCLHRPNPPVSRDPIACNTVSMSVRVPDQIHVDGETFALTIERKQVKNVNARLRGSTVNISAPPTISEKDLKPMVEKLAKRLTRRAHSQRVNEEEDALALADKVARLFPEPPEVDRVLFVTNQRSRRAAIVQKHAPSGSTPPCGECRSGFWRR